MDALVVSVDIWDEREPDAIVSLGGNRKYAEASARGDIVGDIVLGASRGI